MNYAVVSAEVSLRIVSSRLFNRFVFKAKGVYDRYVKLEYCGFPLEQRILNKIFHAKKTLHITFFKFMDNMLLTTKNLE